MPKLLKFFSIASLFSLLFPALTTRVFAQSCDPSDRTGLGFCNDIPASTLITTLLNIAIGVAGGVAFLLLVYGGFRMVASQGDPKALQDARAIITSAISGLLFIIFAVFILRLIGITVLGLPGLPL